MEYLGRRASWSGDDEDRSKGHGWGRTPGIRDLTGAGANATGPNPLFARATDLVTAISRFSREALHEGGALGEWSVKKRERDSSAAKRLSLVP